MPADRAPAVGGGPRPGPTAGTPGAKHRQHAQAASGNNNSSGRGNANNGGRGTGTGRSASSGGGRGGPGGRGGRGSQQQSGRGDGRGRSGRQPSQTGGRGGGAASGGRGGQQHPQQRSASMQHQQQQPQQRAASMQHGRPRLVRSAQTQSYPALGGGPNALTSASSGPQQQQRPSGSHIQAVGGIGPDPATRRASETSMYQSRIRDGLCPTCGIQLFELKKPGLLSKRSTMKRVPLSVDGVVFGGQCLKCNRPGGPATAPSQRRESGDPSLTYNPNDANMAPQTRRSIDHYHAHMQPDRAVPPGAHMGDDLNNSQSSFDGHGSGPLPQQSQPQQQQQAGASGSGGRLSVPTSSSVRSISLRSLDGAGSGTVDIDGISAIPPLGQDFTTDDKKRQLLIEQEILLNQFHASKISQMSQDQSTLHSLISGHRRASALGDAGAGADAGACGATALESTSSPDTHGHRDVGVGVEVNKPFGPGGGLGRQSSSRRGMALGRQGSQGILPAVDEAVSGDAAGKQKQRVRRVDSSDADPVDVVDELAIKAINPDDAMVQEQMRIMEQIEKQNEAAELRVADRTTKTLTSSSPSCSAKAEAEKDLLDGAAMSEKDRKSAERRRRRLEEKARRASAEDIPKDIQIGNYDSGSDISMGDARDALKKEERQKRDNGRTSPTTDDLLAVDEDAIRKQEAILRDIDQKKQEEEKGRKKEHLHHHHGHRQHRSKGKSGSTTDDQPPVPMTIAVNPGGGDKVNDLDDDLEDDGCTYAGDFNADGLRHGRGALEWANGDKYEGQFWNGMRHGAGKLVFADGSEYDGWWKYNRMDGHGTRRFPNGNLYVGNYSDGRRNGSGRHIFANGDQYVGIFKDDAMHGAGRYYFKNNESFEGTFNRGRKEGRGKYQWSDGTIDIIWYIGDVRSGEGVRYSADRKKAWKLEGSKVKGKMSLDEAHKMVESLGSDVTIGDAS